MKIIAGLGNPSKEYEGTRHNVGFMAVDALAELANLEWNDKKHKAICAKGVICGEKVVLLKPQTYMNLSGESIGDAVRFYKCDPKEDVIVLYDDIDLDVGRLRIRAKGSAGGHNGMKSIIAHLGTQEFTRIRIGIGAKPAGWDLADYVLSHFTGDDLTKVASGVKVAAEAAMCCVDLGVEACMNRYNRNGNA